MSQYSDDSLEHHLPHIELHCTHSIARGRILIAKKEDEVEWPRRGWDIFFEPNKYCAQLIFI